MTKRPTLPGTTHSPIWSITSSVCDMERVEEYKTEAQAGDGALFQKVFGKRVRVGRGCPVPGGGWKEGPGWERVPRSRRWLERGSGLGEGALFQKVVRKRVRVGRGCPVPEGG